jgi:hypothetical protein
MRAARTDKGVSAVGQVVSLKMVIEPEGVVDRINAALPDQVCAAGSSLCFCICGGLYVFCLGGWHHALVVMGRL